jgi:hypothetical protein
VVVNVDTAPQCFNIASRVGGGGISREVGGVDAEAGGEQAVDGRALRVVLAGAWAPHETHGLHIGTYKFRLRTGYTKLFVRNKLQVRALHVYA